MRGGLCKDALRAIFWYLVIVATVLFSTGGFKEFIYSNF